MNIVLLSGGSGKRLWPLSNDVRSKQFIRIFKTEDGEYESMLQRMYRVLQSVRTVRRFAFAFCRTSPGKSPGPFSLNPTPLRLPSRKLRRTSKPTRDIPAFRCRGRVSPSSDTF